jgi:AraC family transcriptional activator of pobA
VLTYFERDGGSLRLGEKAWQIEAGDVYLIAPGEIADPSGLEEAEGWGVFFPPEVLGSGVPGAFLSWRAHPLLFPFVRGAAGGAQRLKVPPEDRPAWSERLSALNLELNQRHDSYREAVLAHLTLLLVDLSRLAADVVGDLRLKDTKAPCIRCQEPRDSSPIIGLRQSDSREPTSGSRTADLESHCE